MDKPTFKDDSPVAAGLREKIAAFWPSYIDEFKTDMAERIVANNQLTTDALILTALYEIMNEQQRTGHRSEGWPSPRHQSIRFTLAERTGALKDA